MSIPNPCCCGGCAIYGDKFTTDSIAGSWEVLSGSWSAAAGVLSISDTAALIVANTAHPLGDYQAQNVKVNVRFDTAGDIARIVIAYDDVDNYLFAEYWIDTDGCGHVQMYERIASVESTIGPEYALPFEVAEDAWTTVSLCYVPGASITDPGELITRVTYATHVWRESAATTAGLLGDRGGVGTGATVAGTIDFDEFYFQYYYHSVDHPTCPKCSGGTNCTLHEDTFNRSNSTSVGCAWEEVAGNWEISSNELKIATANSILLNRTQITNANGDLTGYVYMRFKVRCDAGAIIRVLLDYEDTSNYFFVELTPSSHGDSGSVTFWRRTAGTNTQVSHDSVLYGLSDTDQHTLEICWRPDGVVRVTMGTATFSTNEVTQAATTPYVALGTGAGGSAQVWFDDFVMRRLVADANLNDVDLGVCASCPTQGCTLFVNDYHDASNTLWSQEAGTWTDPGSPPITSADGHATSTASNIAIFLLATGHPQATTEGYLDLTSAVYTEFYCEGFSSKIRAILGWQDSSNYLYAEVELSADNASVGHLRIGKVVAGTPTTITTEDTSVSGGQPGQAVNTLRVCYDGYELRAMFYSGSAFAGGEHTYATGTAGTGWNPGKSAVATGTITDTVYFGEFQFYHDIFGGDTNCLPCTLSPECFFCGDNDTGGACLDKTPSIFLVELSGIHMLGAGDPDQCPEEAQFNDTFALPFLVEDAGNYGCRWHTTLLFCESLDGGRSEIFLDITRLISAGPVYQGISVAVTLEAHLPSQNEGSAADGQGVWHRLFIPSAIPSADQFNIGCTTGAPSTPYDEGINCLNFFAEWRTIAETNYPGADLPDGYSYFTGTGWLSGSDYVVGCKARIKVLV